MFEMDIKPKVVPVRDYLRTRFDRVEHVVHHHRSLPRR
jgi:hypothetical protein